MGWGAMHWVPTWYFVRALFSDALSMLCHVADVRLRQNPDFERQPVEWQFRRCGVGTVFACVSGPCISRSHSTAFMFVFGATRGGFVRGSPRCDARLRTLALVTWCMPFFPRK